jgi:hypothetical protein
MHLIKSRKYIIYIILGLVALGLSLVMRGGLPQMQQTVQSVSLPTLSDVPESAWQRLTQQRIWFGHQSVGGNLIEGLKDLRQTHPQIKLNLLETSDPAKENSVGLIHFAIGQNAYPQTKMTEFMARLQQNSAKPPDVALFKFCFLDVHTKTDVAQLFQEYKIMMDRLIKTFPQTKFVQVTVPLTAEPTGKDKLVRDFKYGFRKVLRQPVERSFENMNRSTFNQLLRQTYGNQSTVFDLAQFESIGPDQQQTSFSADGKFYQSLVPRYTDDGAHLNKTGRKMVAEQFLIFLAKLVK